MEKNVNILYINVGVPSSGKSTWSEQYLKQNKNTVRVSRDSFRYMLRNEGWCHYTIEETISDLVDVTVIKALDKGFDVILDATNLREKYINHFTELVKYKADVEFKVFDTPLEVCIERDKLREKTVGEEVILKMYQDWLNIKDKGLFYPRKMQNKEILNIPIDTLSPDLKTRIINNIKKLVRKPYT